MSVAVLGGHQARIDAEPAGLNRVIMKTAAEPQTAHFDHSKTAALAAIFTRQVLQRNDAMRNAGDVQVPLSGRPVFQKQDRAVTIRKKLLERQNLPAIAKRIARQEPHFRK